MSDFDPTHTWHFLGDDIPVVVPREYSDGYGVEDQHGTPFFAKPDELTRRLTAQEAHDVALETRRERAADFDSNWEK